MTMKNLIKDYFTFSSAEQRGMLILLFLILLSLLLRMMIPCFIPDPEVDFSLFRQELSELASLIDSAESAQQKYIDSLPGNKVPLKKYMLKKTDVSHQIPILDINSADSAAMIKLHGVGPVFANRIIKFRDLLGGFYRKEQLFEVYGIDSVRAREIMSQVIIDTSTVVRININTITFKELLKHPYLDYENVKKIINPRQKDGPYSSPDDLMLRSGLTEEFLNRISPYLKFE